jgi:hypothetical protein
MASLAMLVPWKMWEIWKKKNAKMFRNNTSNTILVITKIKEEDAL